MTLARATVRPREMAVRASLGAGSAQLARKLLTECAVLAMTGGLDGAALAASGERAAAGGPPAGLPQVEEIAVEARCSCLRCWSRQ